MDTVDKATRSRIMASIRLVSRLEHEAKPRVRELGKGLGMSFRHQPRGIHGRPDFANKSRKVAVFIHGCFFHGCDVCRYKTPKSNVEFWEKKIRRNKERHEEVYDRLLEGGWRVFVIWEHEVRGKR